MGQPWKLSFLHEPAVAATQSLQLKAPGGVQSSVSSQIDVVNLDVKLGTKEIELKATGSLQYQPAGSSAQAQATVGGEFHATETESIVLQVQWSRDLATGEGTPATLGFGFLGHFKLF